MAIRRSSIAKKKEEKPPSLVPQIKKEITYSEALKEAKKLLGPNARVWHNNRSQIEIGLQFSSHREIKSVGNTFFEAVENLKPIPV